MNISHRSLWNSALGAWVAVSEATRGRGKRSGGGSAVLAGAALLLIGSVPSLGFAQSTWNKTTASAWATAGNWTGGTPGTTTAVTVSQGTAQITANTTIGSLTGVQGGTITVASTRSLTTGGNNTSTTFGGVISGAGSLTKQGTGTMTLTGANNYTGGTTVSAGMLQGNTTSLQGKIVNNAKVTFDQVVAGTYAGVMSGTGSLTKIGTGTLTLSGANTYTGVTTITAGTLQVGAGGTTGTLGTGNVVNNGALAFNRSNALTIANAISGSGSVEKLGSGTTTLTGANTYTGVTTITAGTLRASAANRLSSSSAVTLANTAGVTLDLNNFSQTIGSLAGVGTTGGNVTLGSGTLTTGGNNSSTAYGGIISGATGKLTKVGTGTMILTGANTYGGGTTVNGGVLQGNTTSLKGNIALTNNANVTFDQATAGIYAGTMSGIGSLTKTSSGTLTLAGVHTYSGGTTVSGGVLQGSTSSLQGNILNNANVTFDQATTGTYAGAMSGTGTLTKSGTGILTLSGANTYGGATSINVGTLQAGALNTLSANSALALATGATLNLNNFNQTIGSLANGGNVTLGSGTLSTGGNNTSTSYAGIISGTGGLTKVGNGTMTMTGTNTYSGATSVNAGTLTVNGSNASSAVTVNSGGTLSGTGTVSSTAVASGGTLKGSAGQVLTTGTLVLNSGANVDVALGAPSNTGLFQVNGDLTLGGKLNVSDLGGFGVGVNRIFNYTGALTDNGMALGTAPAGSALTVQTAVDKQVNLVNTAGQTLNFWDGNASANANNGAINGGSGTWTANAGNWTNQNGTLNAPMTPAPGFAVFQGTAGTVTTDSSKGALAVTGMQFASDGYTLQGDAITLSGPTPIIRVSGDGNGNKYTATVASVLTGSAGLEKTDVGTLVLTGANTYTGGTTVSGGVLQGNTTSLQGNITNNANVTFDQAAAGTYASVISGSGSLNKQGAGTLILSGANSYSGGTTVSAGVLQGDSTSLQGNIANNANVTFDQGATGTYAGVMSGTGALNKIGNGNLTLSGINSFTGATSINAGTLTVNGSIANSAVSVNSGATLSGNGTVGSTTIAAGGVLSPGNPLGTLSVKGNATFATGSTYRVEANAAGQADRVNVSGSATINGGKVDVQAGAGTYAVNTIYTVLNAAGGRTGTFAGVTSNLAFLTPTLGYDANNVFLSLTRNDVTYKAIAATPNQGSTAGALQNAISGATGDMNTVLTALTSLSAEQARAAYDSVSGNSLIGLRGAGASFAAGFGSQMQARMGAMQSSSADGVANAFSNRPVLLAANDHVSDLMATGTVSDSPQKFSLAGGAASSNLQSKNDPANGFWLRGSGGFQRTSSDNNGGASKVRNSGLSAGFDTEVREGLRAGVALSGGSSDLSTDSSTSGKSRGNALALYGSYASGPWNFSGSTSLALGRNHMDRTVTVGAINRVASSDFGSRTLSAYGEAAYSLAMTGGWTLQPLAGLSLSRSKADGFTETGAGALNLQVAGQTTTSTKSLLGAKAAFEAGSVRLEPRAIWAHEFGDLNTPMTAQFQGAVNASPFQVSGVALKRDTLILGFGASGSFAKNIDLFADVQAEHNSRQNNLAVLVGLRARW